MLILTLFEPSRCTYLCVAYTIFMLRELACVIFSLLLWTCYILNSRIWWLAANAMVAKLRSVQCKRYFSTRADKNCCNEKFVSVSDDNEFQLIHTLCCLSLSLFVMLSVFIALKHSTLNVSYLKQQQRRGKKPNSNESHRFFNRVSQFSNSNSIQSGLFLSLPFSWLCAQFLFR